jgi:hypothetical protein
VVPAGPLDAWVVRSVPPTLRDGKLCGRDTVDMKGAITAFVAAAQRYLDHRPRGFAGSISLADHGRRGGVRGQRHQEGARLARRHGRPMRRIFTKEMLWLKRRDFEVAMGRAACDRVGRKLTGRAGDEASSAQAASSSAHNRAGA